MDDIGNDLYRSFVKDEAVVGSEADLSVLFNDLFRKDIELNDGQLFGIYWVHPSMLNEDWSAGGYWLCYMNGEPDYILVDTHGYDLLMLFGFIDTLEYPFAITQRLYTTFDNELWYHNDYLLSNVRKKSITGCVRYGNVLVVCVSLQWEYIWLFIDSTTYNLLGIHKVGDGRGNSLVAYLLLLLSKDLNFDLG